jgi:hypothetical protein
MILFSSIERAHMPEKSRESSNGSSKGGSRRSNMHCKDCGNPLRRLARQGFLQLKVYPKLGYYPWECPICRKTTMVKKQYVRKTRKVQENSAD